MLATPTVSNPFFLPMEHACAPSSRTGKTSHVEPATKSLDVPIIDYRELKAGKTQATQALGEALKSIGFVAISHHGIDPADLQGLRDSVNTLLSHDEAYLKEHYYHPETEGERGYRPAKGKRGLAPICKEKTKGNIDPKGIWQLAKSCPVFPNEQDAPGFKAHTRKVYNGVEAVANTVLKRVADYLELTPENRPHLVGDKGQPFPMEIVMRAIRYHGFDPKEADKFDNDTLFQRAAPHTDLGMMTVQVKASDSGLQLKRAGSDEWEMVNLPDNLIMINTGDLLNLMTQNIPGKTIPAAPHRVVATKETALKSRVAIPFFVEFKPNHPVHNLKTGEQLHEDMLHYLFFNNFDNKCKGINPASCSKDFESYKARYLAKQEAMQKLALSA